MKKHGRKKTSSKVISRVKFLRMQVVAAESIWKEAKQHFSRAKRRRKLAKLLARRARTDVKQAKEQFAKLREALARAEANDHTETRRLVRRKTRKVRTAPKAPAAKKKISKGVRLVRTPKIAKPPPVTVLADAVIREANELVSQGSPPVPGQE